MRCCYLLHGYIKEFEFCLFGGFPFQTTAPDECSRTGKRGESYRYGAALDGRLYHRIVQAIGETNGYDESIHVDDELLDRRGNSPPHLG
jgi:hypothetical protein